MRKIYLLILLSLTPGVLSAQDSPAKIMKNLKWLVGSWEGTGLVAQKYGKAPLEQPMTLKFDEASLHVGISASSRIGWTTLFSEELDLTSEYHHFDKSTEQGKYKVEAYFLGEMKPENRVLIITPVSKDQLNVSVSFNRISGPDSFILKGELKKK